MFRCCSHICLYMSTLPTILFSHQFGNISTRRLSDIKKNPSLLSELEQNGAAGPRGRGGTWEFVSRRVDAWMARCPLNVIPVRTRSRINKEEDRDPKRDRRTVSNSLHKDLWSPGNQGGDWDVGGRSADNVTEEASTVKKKIHSFD